MGQGAVAMMRDYAAKKKVGEIPLACHLDHGDSFDLTTSCIATGSRRVMIDGSHLKYDENVGAHPQGVEYAHEPT